MRTPRQPIVSIVLATHNRRSVLAETLERLEGIRAGRIGVEVIVVDNASSDGSGELARKTADDVVVLKRNFGSCAKAFGVERAEGRYVLFLDDDSYPVGDSVERMVGHFDADAKLGAAGFTVRLPDGRQECSALTEVFVGCGVGFRAEALKGCGGLDRTFFMQAEEYDLAFRLAAAGWRVRMFDDLVVEHRKSPVARRSARTTYYDVRNNLRVAARYLPHGPARIYREDSLLRYRWLAEGEGQLGAHRRGAFAGWVRGTLERRAYRAFRLSPALFEHFFGWAFVQQQMASLARAGVERVLLADLGKNIYAFYHAARTAGVIAVAIADDRFGRTGRHYRGIPVLKVCEALRLEFDAVVVSNTAPVFAEETGRRFEEVTKRAVYAWFAPAVDFHSSDHLKIRRFHANERSVAMMDAQS